MTDAQILTAGIVVLAVIVGAISTSSRIGDLDTGVNRRTDGLKEGLLSEMKAIEAGTDVREARMEARFDSFDRKLDEIVKKVKVAKIG